MAVETEIIPSACYWINIEGTDAVGKTSLVKALSQKLSVVYPEIKTVIMPEFSSSPIGVAIQAIIKEKAFFSLSDDAKSPIAETLVLVGDYLSLLENRTIDTARILVTDRGRLSFLVYQGIRLAAKYGNITEWQKWIRDITMFLREPDLTICVISSMETIETRLKERGDTVTNSGLEFIENVQRLFVNQMRYISKDKGLVLENNGTFPELLDKTMIILTEKLERHLN